MSDSEKFAISGDGAIDTGDDDRLGFREAAERIAKSLVNGSSQGGLVIGLEGAWGSGKSSLLSLIVEELGRLPSDTGPSIIHFRPWLIGNRAALIAGLFSDLESELKEIAQQADGKNEEFKKTIDDAIRSLHDIARAASPWIEAFGEIPGLGVAKAAAKGVKNLTDETNEQFSMEKISQKKNKLAEFLQNIKRKFIITVDDVDRLEPAEAIEVLRLVRAVFDLPNVTYILCYDSEILAASIETATGLHDGKAYLEKIVQLPIMVPQPETFQLREWFSHEVFKLAPNLDQDQARRLKDVINYEGGRQLRTPRSVVRTLDGVRLSWAALKDEGIDFPDLGPGLITSSTRLRRSARRRGSFSQACRIGLRCVGSP